MPRKTGRPKRKSTKPAPQPLEIHDRIRLYMEITQRVLALIESLRGPSGCWQDRAGAEAIPAGRAP